MAKKQDEVPLTKTQQRTVIALVAQRDQIAREANTALAEIWGALEELARIYAMDTTNAQYDFELRGQEIVLVKQKEPSPEGKGEVMIDG